MRRPIVAGNWKLNGTRTGISRLIEDIKMGLDAVKSAQVVVCPPFVHLADVATHIQNQAIALGAQDVSEQDQGAFTGEVSAPMLYEYGCRYVIVGHSERRHHYGESDALTAAKFVAARRAGLIPILCVGELLQQRQCDETEQVVAAQLDAVLEQVPAQHMAQTVIAYEPVWAIGTGETATPEQAQSVHCFIRDKIARLDPAAGDAIRILYGGSVNSRNAAELFAMADIDGGLIGGASLKGDEFLAICRAASF